MTYKLNIRRITLGLLPSLRLYLVERWLDIADKRPTQRQEHSADPRRFRGRLGREGVYNTLKKKATTLPSCRIPLSRSPTTWP